MEKRRGLSKQPSKRLLPLILLPGITYERTEDRQSAELVFPCVSCGAIGI